MASLRQAMNAGSMYAAGSGRRGLDIGGLLGKSIKPPPGEQIDGPSNKKRQGNRIQAKEDGPIERQVCEKPVVPDQNHEGKLCEPEPSQGGPDEILNLGLTHW